MTCALPPFVGPYAARFEEIRDTLSLHDGFALLPVEVPSADVARALADWLCQRGRAARVVAPKRNGWRALPAEILSAAGGEGSVVVVIGPAESSADLHAGLRLLNQRRDTVTGRLGAPLLWCGPRSFLDADHLSGQLIVLQMRGDVAVQQGDLSTALQAYLRARDLYETLPEPIGLSGLLSHVAYVLALKGQTVEARAVAERAAALAHDDEARDLAATVLAQLAP